MQGTTVIIPATDDVKKDEDTWTEDSRGIYQDNYGNTNNWMTKSQINTLRKYAKHQQEAIAKAYRA